MMRGFTIPEILFVTAMVGILATITIAPFGAINSSQALITETSSVITALKEARSLSIAARDNSSYGIHFESGALTIFKGSSFVQDDPDNDVIALNPKVAITSISIVGGGSSVVFEKLTGETLQYGTLTLSLVDATSTVRQITINGSGLIE